jgi:hypothetical protein
MSLEITGLTAEQVEMLDFMWDELETEQDFLDWYDCLSEEQQQMADLLQRMVIMGVIDNEMSEQSSFPEAKSVLDKFMK